MLGIPHAESPPEDSAAKKPPRPYQHRKDYVMENLCYKVKTPLRIDGRLDEDAWRKAPWSPRFVDEIGRAHV